MSDLRFAIFGTGFWSRYQLAAWNEVGGARCVALYNRTRSKAEALAQTFAVPAIYDDPNELLQRERLDFIDVISDVGTHSQFAQLAARRGLPVICQKPMASTLAEATSMVSDCQKAGVPLFIHENWRWQHPLRQLKALLREARVGRVFRARIDYCNSFPVFDNQPFLKELDQFILMDMGTHILDVARFLFGEMTSVTCHTQRIHPCIRGEDVATVLLQSEAGAIITCNLSYASRLEHDRFPETFVLVEGEEGSLELAPDYWVRLTTRDETSSRRCPPPFYDWADPRYALVHASIVDCQADLLRALREGSLPETHAEDNLKTLQLVFASYQSAADGKTVRHSGGQSA